MSIIYADTEISSTEPSCREPFQIRLSLAATPDGPDCPGASHILIRYAIAPGFHITSPLCPTKGHAALVGSDLAEWEIPVLGAQEEEGAALTFMAVYEGSGTGLVEVAESISYSDREGNKVVFPSPLVRVDCGTIEIAEACPEPLEIEVDGCTDTLEFDAGDLQPDSLGRILQLDVTLRGICPGKRVALAVILNEVDEFDTEFQRGLKTMTIPAHTRETCQDIIVRCIKFVLPQDLDVSSGCSCICSRRRLRARLIAHYVDHDYICFGPFGR